MTVVGIDTRGELVADVLAAGVAADARGDDAVAFVEHPQAPDPLVLLAALASRTSRIRLVAHVDSARTHPYTFARKLVALDKLSNARAGWYVSDENDARRDEFVDLTERLVLSWDPAALVADKSTGIYVDTDLVHPVHHDGVYWSTHSPLDVGAGPQGVPKRTTKTVVFRGLR